MAWFRDIQALQEPFDPGGTDEAGRAQCVFNVMATKRPSDTLVEEILKVLETAGVGVENVTLFGTSMAQTPRLTSVAEQDEAFLVVRPTGGPGPLGTHNDGAGAYRQPTAQILVRARTYPTAHAMAQRAFAALVAVRNQAVAP